MLTLNLYSFAKKENSTKQPSTASLALQGILKEPCSIMNPIVTIERLSADAMPFSYTYAKWVEAGRYYFIEDWIWVNGLWEVHMKEDVLATFKTEIGATSEYILRTNSTVNFNTDICDTTYPTTTEFVNESYAVSNIFTTDITVGCYIVGIISGGSTSAVGAISYFAMSSTEFGDLKDALFGDDNLISMDLLDVTDPNNPIWKPADISQEVFKTMYNPYQYIVSCMWFPFGKSAIPNKSSQTTIKIGWWDYSLSGDLIYAQTFELGNEQFTITAHPQASRGNSLNYAPYTRRTLIGRFGSVPIDTSYFAVGTIINISYMIDLITGQCYAKIAAKDGAAEDLIAERNFLLGVPIQIAQVGTDYLGTAVNAIGAVSGAIGGAVSGLATGGIAGAIGGAIAGGASGIYNTLQSAMPQVETGGQNGSFLAPKNQTHVVEQFYKIVDEDIDHRGRPLCELRQINTLSGFILCAEGDMDISCYDDERKEIVRYLTTGFFWE